MSTKNSADFKAKVALEAISHNIGELHKLAEKYNVTENEIISWVDELKDNAPELYTEEVKAAAQKVSSEWVSKDFDLPAQDEDFNVDYARGVSDDRLNLKRITKWFIGGAISIFIGIVLLVQFANYSVKNAQDKVSEASQFEDITNLNKEQNETLNSFGVIDMEKGIYHIPIGDAIDNIVND